MTTDERNLADNTSICLVFLMDGFNQAHGRMFGKGQHANEYETHAAKHGGYIGIVGDFLIYARIIENHLAIDYEEKDFPGVFHYEVTEDLGGWLFDNPRAPAIAFAKHAIATIDKWFADGGTAQHVTARVLSPVHGAHDSSDPAVLTRAE